MLDLGRSARPAPLGACMLGVSGGAENGLVDPDLPYDALRAWLLERLVPDQAVTEETHALFVRAGYNHCKPKARCESCPAPTPER